MNEKYTRQEMRIGKMFIGFALFQIVVLLLATVAWMFLPWLGMAGRNENEAIILMLAPLLGGWAFSAISAIFAPLSTFTDRCLYVHIIFLALALFLIFPNSLFRSCR